MTDNMETMFEDIMCALFQSFPKKHIEYCFGECYPIHPLVYGKYVMLEFVKNAYYESMEKHSLRFYLNYSAEDADHSERMRYARSFKYTQKYKDYNYAMLIAEEKDNPDRLKKLEQLRNKDMKTVSNRLKGYELTAMDVFEHTNVQELRIIKSIVEKRLFSSKKVSNEQFIDIFDEYDLWVQGLVEKSKKSDDDLLFAAMALFTLEWKYSLEFIYLVADYMEQKKINEVDFYTLWALALPLRFDSRLGCQLSGENRMVKERQFLISDLIKEGDADAVIVRYRNKYIEIEGLTVLFNNMTSIDGILYKEWFKNNTTMEDWASFIKEYKMFDIWTRKEWTNIKIKNARKLLKMLTPTRDYTP